MAVLGLSNRMKPFKDLHFCQVLELHSREWAERTIRASKPFDRTDKGEE